MIRIVPKPYFHLIAKIPSKVQELMRKPKKMHVKNSTESCIHDRRDSKQKERINQQIATNPTSRSEIQERAPKDCSFGLGGGWERGFHLDEIVFGGGVSGGQRGGGFLLVFGRGLSRGRSMGEDGRRLPRHLAAAAAQHAAAARFATLSL